MALFQIAQIVIDRRLVEWGYNKSFHWCFRCTDLEFEINSSPKALYPTMAATNPHFMSKISKIELFGCILDTVIMTPLAGLLHNVK